MHPSLKIRAYDVKLFLAGMFIVFSVKSLATLWSTSNSSCLPDDVRIIDRKNLSALALTDTGYAKRLAMKINIYCYILTDPTSHQSKAYHAQATWVRRCTRYGFVSSSSAKTLRMLETNRPKDDYNRNSWNSMRETLRAVYLQKSQAEFFLKADDSIYIIMENLRHALEFEDPNEPFLMGRIHEPNALGDKLSGSFGYVLSRAALELIVTKGLDYVKACGPIGNIVEDVQIGLCAEAVGVKIKDSIDMLGKSRFTNVPIKDLLGPFPNGTARWNPAETDYTQPVYDLRKLPASPLTISFGGLEPVMMYVLEYLVYHLRPIGITHKILREIPVTVVNKMAQSRTH